MHHPHLKTGWTRRRFTGASALAGAGLAWRAPAAPSPGSPSGNALPAILGGPQAHPEPHPAWPVWSDTDREAIDGVLRSGHWFRGNGMAVAGFEEAFAALMGARCCLATASGTAALTAALGAIEVGPGDEVLIPPYTFVATYNAVVMHHALPVFVDVDAEHFQIDAGRLAAAITPETRAIVPVHLGGSPVDLDAVLDAAKAREIPVIEDACQAHLAEWRGRKVGTFGRAGCFSFQASKNLTSGEGGAVVTDDPEFAEACYRFHYHGRGRRFLKAESAPTATRGTNLRLAEFQAGLLLSQMKRLEDQARRRHDNAGYLTTLLRDCPGIEPARLHGGTTRGAWHLYMMRYDPAGFEGLPRARFIAALGREGIAASTGYAPLHREPYVTGLARNRHYLRIHGEARMKRWLEQTLACPGNDRACASAVWLGQQVLLEDRTAMERIADAIRRIQRHAGAIARA